MIHPFGRGSIACLLLALCLACGKDSTTSDEPDETSGDLRRPAGLRALAVTPTSVSLGWDDLSRYESSYIVERGEERGDGSGAPTFYDRAALPANAATHVDTDEVESGVTYHYRVAAVDRRGLRFYSNVINVTTPAPTTADVEPSCSDGIKNQGESGVDCGGPCPACSASDATAPSISITCPSPGTYSSPTISVSGTASDNAGLSKVEVKVGFGGTYRLVTGTTSWSTSGLVLAGGSNTIYAKAIDAAGNTKETSIAVTYDSSASLQEGTCCGTGVFTPETGESIETIGIPRAELMEPDTMPACLSRIAWSSFPHLPCQEAEPDGQVSSRSERVPHTTATATNTTK